MWRELQIPNVFTMESSFCGADRGELKDQHFTPNHLMGAGEKILSALLIYCKIDVEKAIAQMKKGAGAKDAPITEPTLPTLKVKLAEIESELAQNRKLIEMTSGDEDGDGDAGSDSEPSEDNMEEDQLAEIVPI
jgi:hypothetical protein